MREGNDEANNWWGLGCKAFWGLDAYGDQCVIVFFICFFVQGLSRYRDGLLVVEMDLNLCRQVRDKWGFQASFSALQLCYYYML